MHVRLHYTKFNKTLRQRFVEKKNNHINLSISRSTFSITFKSMTASAKLLYLFIFMTKAQFARFIVFLIDFSITSMNSTAFKSSRRHEFTCMFFTISSSSFQTSILLHSTSFQKTVIMKLKFHYFSIFSIISRSTSTILKSSHHSIIIMNASIVCSFTFSSTSSRSSIASHQKSHTSKHYMIMKNLFEMFAEKSSKRNMNIIQKKSTSSCFSKSRQTRIKSLRQRDFRNTVMLAKKQFKKNLNAIRKRMRFSLFSMFNQIQIINYFKFID